MAGDRSKSGLELLKRDHPDSDMCLLIFSHMIFPKCECYPTEEHLPYSVRSSLVFEMLELNDHLSELCRKNSSRKVEVWKSSNSVSLLFSYILYY